MKLNNFKSLYVLELFAGSRSFGKTAETLGIDMTRPEEDEAEV